MFVVPRTAPLAVARTTEAAPAQEVEAPSTPASPFAQSSFQAGRAAPYFPTNAELNRPTPAYVVNITNGERQPLNPQQMSTVQGVGFAYQQLERLGYGGPNVAANTTFPTSGPFRIDYAGDDRQHWDIDGMNVGLIQQLYANNPKEVADRMLADNMKYARKPSWENDDGAPQIPPQLLAPRPSPFPAMRMMPGVDFGTVYRASVNDD
jgi:hypothetical protein